MGSVGTKIDGARRNIHAGLFSIMRYDYLLIPDLLKKQPAPHARQTTGFRA